MGERGSLLLMVNIDINNIEHVKNFMYGLVIECPFRSDPNPVYCVFHEVRFLPVEERFKWVDSLSDESCLERYLAHKKCYTERAAKEGLV